jgi:hypothetical protein
MPAEPWDPDLGTLKAYLNPEDPKDGALLKELLARPDALRINAALEMLEHSMVLLERLRLESKDWFGAMYDNARDLAFDGLFANDFPDVEHYYPQLLNLDTDDKIVTRAREIIKARKEAASGQVH